MMVSGPPRGVGQGGTMTPGPMRGLMGFMKAAGFSRPSREPMSSGGAH